MQNQPGAGDEFKVCATTTKTDPDRAQAVGSQDDSALRLAIADLDCAVDLTELADADLVDDRAEALNLFTTSPEADDHRAEINILREGRLTHAGRRRIVALRRRAMRARLNQGVPMPREDLSQLRALFTMPDPDLLAGDDRPSVPLRLATHAISLSLVATALPVGAALMTYNLLKGEDIKATARMTTLTGLALVVIAGNPGLAHLIGV
jgi:hypothetical protein